MSQNSQEYTYTKRLWRRCFSVIFMKFLRKLFQKTPPVAAYGLITFEPLTFGFGSAYKNKAAIVKMNEKRKNIVKVIWKIKYENNVVKITDIPIISKRVMLLEYFIISDIITPLIA